MTVLRLALRSLGQRRLSTALTALGVALGVGLVVFVVTVRDASRGAFDAAARGYDVVVGGVQTSALTTVLNAVFHVDKPVDTIPVAVLDDLRADGRVQHAVPTAVGDVYEGYRVVGTTPEFFDAVADARGRPLRDRIARGGRVLGGDGEFEAVVGSIVASRRGLSRGSQIGVTHGVEGGGHEHEERWTVVGVLEPTGTPNDRAVFITLGSFFEVKGHEPPPPAAGAGAGGADAAKPGADGAGGGAAAGTKPWALSAVLVRLKSPAFRFQFAADVNRRKDVRAAIPSLEISRLFDIVQNVDALLRAVSLLVLVVAGLSILVGLYNTIQGRRREIAILRALGARPHHVFAVVVLEAVILCLLGGVGGLLLGHGGVAAAAPVLLDRLGIRIGAGPVDLSLHAAVVAGLVGLGALAGFLPAWTAFRTPVAQNLHPID